MPDGKGFDLLELKKITGNDAKALAHLSALFISTARESILLIEEHIVLDNKEAVVKILHRLKPNVEMFGMFEIHQEILFLEKNELETSAFEKRLTTLLSSLGEVLVALESEI